MIKETIPGIDKLSPSEKAILAQELWADAYPDEDAVDEAVISKLEERWEHYQSHPETASTWNEVKQRLLKKSS